MRSGVIGFVVGVGWLQMQAALPSFFLLSLSAALVVSLVWLLRVVRHRMARIIASAVLGVVLGFSWAAVVAHYYLAEELPAAMEGQDVTVVGTIDSLPFHFERGVRFNFAVEQVLPVDGVTPQIPSKIALSWYSAFNADDAQTVGDVHPGERWQLTVRLRRPHGNANPHGFDYEVWLLEQQIRATGYVRGDQNASLKNERRDAFVVSVHNVIERSRAWLRSRIERTLQDQPYAGVIVALVIGDQRSISQSDWTVFNNTGISHLVRIRWL